MQQLSKHQLKSGDIILFRNEFLWHSPVTWLATIIRLFTKCKYNHAGVVVSNWNVLFINEALGNGIKTRPLLKYLYRPCSSYLVLRGRDKIYEHSFCPRANAMIGVKYDFKAILDQAWFRITGKWSGSTGSNAEGRMICTEYVAWCHQLHSSWTYSCKELMNHPYFTTYELK